MAITTNLGKAKDAAHNLRRQNRDAKFNAKQEDTRLSIDQMVAIPDMQAEGLARRKTTLDQNAAAQVAIDKSSDEQSLKAALKSLDEPAAPQAPALHAVNE